ncbi:phage holin family protein [Legionella tunisiensis]|uniref:phage holin family protein n=1 Tax=Legionella tunisiensis TaxID=1034944 RepID=UPI0002D3A675|nr:phage holin family protein [Legionella tunisiensis]
MIDFAKESTNLYSEIYNKQLGDREISAETLVELKRLEKQIDGFEAEQFIANQELLAEQWSTEKKWMKGAGYAASFAGFALAFAGLAFLIPGIGVPVAAILIVTVLAAVITAATALLIGVKIMRERQELQKRQEEVDKQIENDDRLLAEVDLEMLKPSESLRNSFTVVFEKEQEANEQEVKKLALTPKQRREAFFHEKEDEGEGRNETDDEQQEQIGKGDSGEEDEAKSPGKN